MSKEFSRLVDCHLSAFYWSMMYDDTLIVLRNWPSQDAKGMLFICMHACVSVQSFLPFHLNCHYYDCVFLEYVNESCEQNDGIQRNAPNTPIESIRDRARVNKCSTPKSIYTHKIIDTQTKRWNHKLIDFIGSPYKRILLDQIGI